MYAFDSFDLFFFFLLDPYSFDLFVALKLPSDFCSGQTSLSWIMRLQILLDAARGLEYIHEHTKPHYVHRDIKTSNILLDGAFRAKVSTYLTSTVLFL